MLAGFDVNSHFRILFEILERKKMTGSINMENFILTINYGEHQHKLFPQFQLEDGNYSPRMTSSAKRFIGYRPYGAVAWDLAMDKVRFKKLLADYDIPHPWWSEDPDVVESGVLIKKRVTAFGIGMKGPFRSTLEHKLNADEGEFYEQFVSGMIVKVWFWNQNAIAAETIPSSTVLGNGVLSIRDLILAKAEAHNVVVKVEDFETYLKYQGLDLDTVLPDKQRCPVDYQYKSKLPSVEGWDVLIGTDNFFGVEPVLERVGQMIVENLPENLQGDRVFAIDGVIDRTNRLWVFELNTNPFVHPFVYEPMIESWRQTVS